MPDEHSQVTDLQAVIGEVAEGSLESPLSAAEQRQIVRLVHSSISHSGPLPSPERLAAYEQVLPGSAKRIFLMAETQSAHRQEMEKAVILGNVSAQSRGVWLAFTLAITGMLLGFCLELRGHRLTGFGFFLSSLAALVGTFVVGRLEQRKERQETQSPDPELES